MPVVAIHRFFCVFHHRYSPLVFSTALRVKGVVHSVKLSCTSTYVLDVHAHCENSGQRIPMQPSGLGGGDFFTLHPQHLAPHLPKPSIHLPKHSIIAIPSHTAPTCCSTRRKEVSRGSADAALYFVLFFFLFSHFIKARTDFYQGHSR